jgi:hypothetical protein
MHEEPAISVAWDEGQWAECRSAADLERLLDRLHAGCDTARPKGVIVSVPGWEVMIAVGTDPSFVLIQEEPYAGTDWITVGDGSAEDVLRVFGAVRYAEIDHRHLVPLVLARQAVRQFVESGTRLPALRWVPTASVDQAEPDVAADRGP